MTTNDRMNLDEVAASIVRAFPPLDVFERRLSLELYRLLASGEPVPRELLAERLQVPIEIVNRSLKAWPGVFSNNQGRIVGYWGLSLPTAYASPHRLMIGGVRLSAWCAWDTLFLPHLLGKGATIESTSPASGDNITLKVTPEAVEQVNPADTCMSFLLPDAAAIQKDVLTTFCHFVHFFPSRRAAERWIGEHKGTFLLSIEEASVVARRKNELQFAEF